MKTALACCVAISLIGCGRAAPAPTDSPPAPVVDATPQRAAPADTAEVAAVDAVAAPPVDPGEGELPLAPGPAPTAWTPDLVPAPVREDVGARALLAAVATDGLAGHVDPALGLVWEQDGERRVVAANAVAKLEGPLQAALTSGAEAARCRGGICHVAAAGRWFILVRRMSGGDPVVAGALHVADGWPAADDYVSWATEARQRWQAVGPSIIGGALSLEEGGQYERAFQGFARLSQADPDNPWPLYYMARTQAAQGRYREAYVSYRRLAEHPGATAIVAQLRVDTDEEMARFRTHSAVFPLQAELALPAPDAPEAFVAWLQRFRAVPERLATVIGAGGPAPQAVGALLEAHLLDAPEVSASAVGWTGASLALRRNALGALEITGLSEAASAAPGAGPPE